MIQGDHCFAVCFGLIHGLSFKEAIKNEFKTHKLQTLLYSYPPLCRSVPPGGGNTYYHTSSCAKADNSIVLDLPTANVENVSPDSCSEHSDCDALIVADTSSSVYDSFCSIFPAPTFADNFPAANLDNASPASSFEYVDELFSSIFPAPAFADDARFLDNNDFVFESSARKPLASPLSLTSEQNVCGSGSFSNSCINSPFAPEQSVLNSSATVPASQVSSLTTADALSASSPSNLSPQLNQLLNADGLASACTISDLASTPGQPFAVPQLSIQTCEASSASSSNLVHSCQPFAASVLSSFRDDMNSVQIGQSDAVLVPSSFCDDFDFFASVDLHIDDYISSLSNASRHDLNHEVNR